ncbi:MAG: hypothetical protein IKR57_01785 [Bacilli bacterium]|nr:hypothetical protein [Bacilli bacterium]
MNTNFEEYKNIVYKYYKEEEINIWYVGYLIFNYIMQFGDNIENFEEYLRKFKNLQDELGSDNNE